MSNFYNEDFELMNALFEYNFLDFNLIKKYYYKTLCEKTVKRRIKDLHDQGYIHIYVIGSRRKQNYKRIFCLDKKGFMSLEKSYTGKLHKKNALVNKTWSHSLTIAHILHNFSYSEKLNGRDVKKLSQKKAYHFFGENKREYNKVLRPNGALVYKDHVIFLEYENSNNSVNYKEKLYKYQHYQQDQLLITHPQIKRQEVFNVLFVFNTEITAQNAIKEITKIITTYDYTLNIYVNTLQNILNNPSVRDKYIKVEGDKKDV